MRGNRVLAPLLLTLLLAVGVSCGQESLTTGDREAWQNFCTTAPVDLPWRVCEGNLIQMEAAIEDGWSKDCAIGWYKDKVRSRNPDPYRCE